MGCDDKTHSASSKKGVADMEYEWVNVPKGDDLEFIYNSVRWHKHWLLPGGKMSSNPDHRWYMDDTGTIYIERRIEVEQKPEMVSLYAQYTNSDGEIKYFDRKAISYKSAVELGLIKE